MSKEKASTFLLKHMVKDLKELSQFLGLSVDDVVIVLHQIFNRIRTTNVITFMFLSENSFAKNISIFNMPAVAWHYSALWLIS